MAYLLSYWYSKLWFFTDWNVFSCWIECWFNIKIYFYLNHLWRLLICVPDANILSLSTFWLYLVFSDFKLIFWNGGVLDSQQNWIESTKISQLFSDPTQIRPSFYQYFPPEWYICYSWWTFIDISLSPEVLSLYKGLLVMLYIPCILISVFTIVESYRIMPST